MVAKYIIGIDEAGRGPLAGPVALGAVCIPTEGRPRMSILGRPSVPYAKYFKGARDSKKMTPAAREEIFRKMKAAAKDGRIRYAVAFASETVIDQKGISFAIRKCIKECLRKLEARPGEASILLDGSLKAPVEFIYQKTIIKGDDKELAISLASIAAKVMRDARMKKVAKKFPQYGFDIHKGYGTRMHRENIKKFGACEAHRRTFCKNIVSVL